MAQTPSALPPACQIADRLCVLKELEATADTITEPRWRDISYRELAKLLTAEGKTQEAIALIDRINDADTRALTIRGIGMGAAALKLSPEAYTDLFAKLTSKAEEISKKDSGEIAYTYISMGQAYAMQPDAAVKTAMAIETLALRNKALGEMAEIQAERHEDAAALKTLTLIEDQTYRNKASRTIAILLSDRALYPSAYQAAHAITNPTLKAEALQHILTKQKPPPSITQTDPPKVSP